MAKNPTAGHELSRHWENYWRQLPNERGVHDAAVTGAARSETFRAMWAGFFGQEFAARNQQQLIDLGCGAGVVIDNALGAMEDHGHAAAHFIGADYAESAAHQIQRKRITGTPTLVSGLASDIAALPFPDGAFNIVVSQFGVEYAGRAAFQEIGRITAVGGAVMCLSHYARGSISQECANNLAICLAVKKSGLLEAGAAIFANPANPNEGLGRFQKAITVLQPLAGDPTPSAAKDLMIRLGDDLARMVNRRLAFAPDDALQWIEAMMGEVSLYADRMQAMVGAALDEEAVDHIVSDWKSVGLVVEPPTPVTLDNASAPAAWRLCARRA